MIAMANEYIIIISFVKFVHVMKNWNVAYVTNEYNSTINSNSTPSFADERLLG